MRLNKYSVGTSGKRHRRGSVLAISLIVVMVIASLGAGLIQMHGAIARRQLQNIDNKRALYIAEAGLSEAFMAIAHGKSGAIGSEEEPALFGNGVFWVEAAEQPDNSVAIVSNGLCETGRFSLAMTVSREVSPIAASGLFGADSVTIGEGTIIDGYDSQAGSFASQVDPGLAHASTGQGARITSNSEIQITAAGGGGGGGGGGGMKGIGMGGGGASNSTWIYGDAIPGPKSGVLADPGVLITGDTMPALKPIELERLELPQGLELSTSLSHSGVRPLVLSDLEAQYRKINVASGSELVLEGPVTIRSTGMNLEPGAKLSIDTTNGPVMIYVTAYLNLSDGSILENTSQDPTQVALVVGANDEREVDIDGDGNADAAVTMGAEGEFYGMFYAPRTDLTIPEKLRMYGCLSGSNVEFEAGSHYSYDTAMATTGVAVTGLPGLLSWRIVELPDSPLVKRRRDPIRALRKAGVVLRQSHQAYTETFIRINYTDAADNPQTYEGPEGSFDWGLVKEVDKMRWAGNLGDLNTAPESTANGGMLPVMNF